MNNTLIKLIESSNLEKSKADYMLQKFQDYSRIAEEWAEKAKTIIVTSVMQTDEMKLAREGRLILKQKRVEIDKTRKELKEQSLREGQAIDKIAKSLTSLIEPTEKYLEEQEKFVEIQEEKRKTKLKAERSEILVQYDAVPELYRLDLMSEDEFNNLLMNLKVSFEQKIQAEKERVEKEKTEKIEAERIRQENEKLRETAIKEKIKYEAMVKAEQKKSVEAEQLRIEKKKLEELNKELEEKAKTPESNRDDCHPDKCVGLQVPAIIKTSRGEGMITCPNCGFNMIVQIR